MVLAGSEGQQPPHCMDFTDMIHKDKGDRGRGGGSGYWHQFLA